MKEGSRKNRGKRIERRTENGEGRMEDDKMEDGGQGGIGHGEWEEEDGDEEQRKERERMINPAGGIKIRTLYLQPFTEFFLNVSRKQISHQFQITRRAQLQYNQSTPVQKIAVDGRHKKHKREERRNGGVGEIPPEGRVR
jgi:hypothetical protein